MKKLFAMIAIFSMLLSGFAVAEGFDLSGYSDEELENLDIAIQFERDRRAYEAAENTEETEAVPVDVPLDAIADVDNNQLPTLSEPIKLGTRGDNVVALQNKLNELGFAVGKADGIFGAKSEIALKSLQAAMGLEQTGVVNTEEEFNSILDAAIGDGENIAGGTSSEWSDWMTPAFNEQNRCFTVAYAYPGERQIGDVYTCQLEIEFLDVTATDRTEDQTFAFWTQGAVDGVWDIGNVWNSRLIKLYEAPSNGVYKYVASASITEKNVNSIRFDIGFRCDYWASGSFRVRNVKVEKGSVATEWSIAPSDEGDGANIAVGTSSEWSDWMTPEANAQNKCFNAAIAYPGERKVGDAYTCQIEIEFLDVTATTGGENQSFGFWTQGAVDDSWDIGNFWNESLVRLKEVPENGTYKYTATSRITDKNVNADKFNLGFRCDYWATGSFRVRNIKVEKGTIATKWTPAPEAALP